MSQALIGIQRGTMGDHGDHGDSPDQHSPSLCPPFALPRVSRLPATWPRRLRFLPSASAATGTRLRPLARAPNRSYRMGAEGCRGGQVQGRRSAEGAEGDWFMTTHAEGDRSRGDDGDSPRSPSPMPVPDLRLWTDAFWAAVNPEVGIVGFQRSEPGWLSLPRDYAMPDFDLWYIASGRGAVQVDGVWHVFGAGDLLCLKPGDRYQRERTNDADPFQLYFAHLLPFGRQDGGLNQVLAAAWPLRLPLPHRPEFPRLFTEFFEAFATRPPRPSLFVKGLALQILDIVFEELLRVPRQAQLGVHPGVLRAKALIERSYAEPLTVPDLAVAGGLCPSHLSALFVRHLGASPFEYLLRVRIREARLLLARGVRVKEVARLTGFGSQHHFCRLFRQRTGETPTAFARQSRWHGGGDG